MITALSVIVPDKGKGLKKLINHLKKDRIIVQIKTARGVNLKHITYTSYSGKLKLEKVDKIVGAQRNHILCKQGLVFPKESGYRRFCSPAFTARLCINMAIYVLRNCVCAGRLKLGIYDPDGVACDFLSLALRYCSDITVVTQNSDSYHEELNIAMEELGATAVITNRKYELIDCDFVVAPQNINEKLPIKRDALVLTNGCPKQHVQGLVYYKYYLRMPNGFDRIKPAELDEEYFCSALYTLGAQYELGSIVPAVCRNYSSSQTVKSLCAYVNRFA